VEPHYLDSSLNLLQLLPAYLGLTEKVFLLSSET
jgi:hypothetical protein